ncbi:MAG: HEAT repeat domain-containing protein, partial [Anaerolineae bacterium]
MDERTLKLQLTGPDEAQRYRAAQMLAEQASIEGLMAAVKDDSWRVRRVAVEGLAQHPDSAGVIAALLNTLRTDHQDLGTLNSVIMVMTAEDVDVITPLVDLLQGNDTNLRIYAALILGHQHDLRVVPHLLQALDDPDANVRFHVIEALGRLQAAESGNKLGEVLVSGDFF